MNLTTAVSDPGLPLNPVKRSDVKTLLTFRDIDLQPSIQILEKVDRTDDKAALRLVKIQQGELLPENIREVSIVKDRLEPGNSKQGSRRYSLKEIKQIATSLGIKGIGSTKKASIISMIKTQLDKTEL